MANPSIWELEDLEKSRFQAVSLIAPCKCNVSSAMVLPYVEWLLLEELVDELRNANMGMNI